MPIKLAKGTQVMTWAEFLAQYDIKPDTPGSSEQMRNYLDYINGRLYPRTPPPITVKPNYKRIAPSGNTTGQFQSHLYPKQGGTTYSKLKAASKAPYNLYPKTSGLRTAVTTTARQTPALMELYGRKKSIGGSPSVRE